MIPLLLLFSLLVPSAFSQTQGRPRPASGFSPVRVSRSSGPAVVTLPASDVKVPAKGAHSYPLGSTFRTDGQATAEMAVTPGCTCVLYGNTCVTVTPGSNIADRVVNLISGAVHCSFKPTGPKTSVKTPAGLVTTTNGVFVCSVQPSAETTATEIALTDGEVELAGNVYKVFGFTPGSVLNVTSSDEDHILSMRKGMAYVTVPGPYGVSVTRELKEKTTMMVGWKEKTDGSRAAYIVFIHPDGTDESWEVIGMGEEMADARAGEMVTLGISLGGSEYLSEEALRDLIITTLYDWQ